MVRLKPLLSFTTDGKGKTDIDVIAGEYENVNIQSRDGSMQYENS